MNTEHKSFVRKAICPLCKWAISTIPNMRNHLKRIHDNTPILNNKIDGHKIKWVLISKKDLMNGRYYDPMSDSSEESSPNDETTSSEISLSTDDESNISLARLAQTLRQNEQRDDQELQQVIDNVDDMSAGKYQIAILFIQNGTIWMHSVFQQKPCVN